MFGSSPPSASGLTGSVRLYRIPPSSAPAIPELFQPANLYLSLQLFE